MATRDLELTTILTFQIPEGTNVGEYPINVLGVNDDIELQDKFIYTAPPQETVIGTSRGITLSIVDPIIKKPI